MTELTFPLHEKQLEVHNSLTRNNVVAAGRRAGKTHYACVNLLLKGLADTGFAGRPLNSNNKVWYIAPTYGQAKELVWNLLKEMAAPLKPSVYKKDLMLVLPNGREITLKGADKPETLRGPSLSHVVLDEYADIKPYVFEEIVEPALAECYGTALFIGTPKKGKIHFYQYYTLGQSPHEKDWSSFRFKTEDNPFVPREVIEAARNRLPAAVFEQEWEASFEAAASSAIDKNDIKIVDHAPASGQVFVTMDPAGFGNLANKSRAQIQRLDEHAIAVTQVNTAGWTVLDVVHGRWGPREAAIRFLHTVRKYGADACGIESGSLMNAMQDYLHDEMGRLRFYTSITQLKHGGAKKTERILWALQGRAEHGRLRFRRGPWNAEALSQIGDFPNPLVHDDIPDAIAYTDQLAPSAYENYVTEDDTWAPLDEISGI